MTTIVIPIAAAATRPAPTRTQPDRGVKTHQSIPIQTAQRHPPR